MQQRRFLTVIFGVFLLALSGLWYLSNQQKDGPKYYSAFNEKALEKEVKSPNAGYRGAAEYLHMLQKNPQTGKVAMADIQKAIDQANSNSRAKKSSHIQWESMGPNNVGGRTRAIVVDNDDPRTLYAGGVSGGLWKSTNRGQSWNRVPYEGADQFKALTIVCMEQASDGTLYFGTGEQGFTSSNPTRHLSSGNVGMGMWKSEDKGETWEHLESTIPDARFSGNSSSWSNVHEIAIDPNNPERILAGTDEDLQISEDGGETWESAGVSFSGVLEVNFSPDGQTVLATTVDGRLFKSTDRGNSFQNIKSDAGISQNAARIETAFAPSDPNYIYLSIAKGDNTLEGVYKSEDNGQNWERILKDGTIVDPFTRTRANNNPQGNYDNVIAVDPYNKDRIFVGGIEFWLYDGDWKKAASEVNTPNNPFYLHVDHHEIVFDTVSDPPVMYSGSDGGIAMSRDFNKTRSPTYKDRNLGYNTSQFYAFDVDKNGNIVGGMQDNGIQKRLKEGITGKRYNRLIGGDGFYAEISELNPNAFIFESQNANIRRSPDQGGSVSESWQVYESFDCDDAFISCNDNGDITGVVNAPFNTPFQLWENGYDTLSNDSVFFTGDTLVNYAEGMVIQADTIRDGYEQFYQKDTVNFTQTNSGNYEVDRGLANVPGEVVTVFSNNAIEFKDTLRKGLVPEEDYLIQDVIRTFFVMTISNEVWLTKDILKFGSPPEWFKIADIDLDNPLGLDFSEDGDKVFIGGHNSLTGKVVRISGLRTALFRKDSTGNFDPDSAGIKSEELGTFNGFITNVEVDDNDPTRLLATAGNYGDINHVFYSENALDSAQNVTFDALDDAGSPDDNLPQMPVYDGLFLNGSTDTIIVGTEMGIWTHDMGNPSEGWQENNQGMDRVPTHMLKQVQWKEWHDNSKVFAATHGRGIFRTGSFHTSTEDSGPESVEASGTDNQQRVNLFPNPASNRTNIAFELEDETNVKVNVYSVSGELVKQKAYDQLNEGEQQIQLNTSQYQSGQYIIQVDGGSFAESTKLLVR